METITIVDARMGRGKSTAAISYMNQHKGDTNFLYVTPYLSEVERICEQCGFEQPGSEFSSKSADLKILLMKRRSIATTHSLFSLLDKEALSYISDRRYTLIIDENIETAARLNVSESDTKLLLNNLTEETVGGQLLWTADDYHGRFSDLKAMAEAGSLFRVDSALLSVMNPALLLPFEKVVLCTYMFEGQYTKAYLDFYEIPYNIIGITETNAGYVFSEEPDAPPPIDYNRLITIVDSPRMNKIGDSRTSLSKSWYGRKIFDDKEMKSLRNNMRNFFQRISPSHTDDRLWTCFKDERGKLIEKNGRFGNSFLQLGARATNAYRDCNHLAYMVNRFADPNLKKFFYTKGCFVDEDQFALSEMLQWIWRSAIRDDKPIDLYIPSKRMRSLLMEWIKQNAAA